MDIQPEKKKMSRGCLVGLIVLGVIVVLVIIAGLVCYSKRDDFMKFALNTGITEMTETIAESHIAGIDTTKVNRIVLRFTERFEADTLDIDRWGRLIGEMQVILSDEAVDSLEAEQFLESLKNYFDRPPIEAVTEDDTTASESGFEESF